MGKLGMKRLVSGFLMLGLWGILSLNAGASVVTVTSNPLWTDTGISLTPSESVTFSGATGSWTWEVPIGPFGPQGDPASNPADQWITAGNHGELIGYVDPTSSLNLNAIPRVIAQDAAGLFQIGANTVTISGMQGELWLGFNDDYSSYAVGDNAGSVTVNVAVGAIPEPSTFIIWSLLGGAALGLAWWRKRKAA